MSNLSKPTTKLVFSAMAVAMAFITSYIKLWNMPMGGSITPFSMLFICLIGYWFGPKYGIMTGVAFGILQFVSDPIMVSIPQVLLDYPIAFGALGLSGFFAAKKYGLYTGYIVGVLGRFVFSTLSGVLFFASYAGGQNVWVYSSIYQASYMFPEALITLLLLAIPAISHSLAKVKAMAQA